MGLHDSYATARGQILMMDPLPSVLQAFSLIKQDEKQRQGYLPSYSDGASFAATGRNVHSQYKDFTHSGHSQYSTSSIIKEMLQVQVVLLVIVLRIQLLNNH